MIKKWIIFKCQFNINHVNWRESIFIRINLGFSLKLYTQFYSINLVVLVLVLELVGCRFVGVKDKLDVVLGKLLIYLIVCFWDKAFKCFWDKVKSYPKFVKYSTEISHI